MENAGASKPPAYGKGGCNRKVAAGGISRRAWRVIMKNIDILDKEFVSKDTVPMCPNCNMPMNVSENPNDYTTAWCNCGKKIHGIPLDGSVKFYNLKTCTLFV
jgi:hypothetical protein